jgi:6-pyruvoyltetrahydropterin/6-carboxytetrahydropterin synthase
MFELTVSREFCAAHSLQFRGASEPVHGHNFRVRVTLEGPALDPDGVLIDFHAVETLLDEIIRPMRNANLNAVAPFADTERSGGINPSAEHIAKVIAERLGGGVKGIPGHAARVASVSVTEAPGCEATYKPPR